MWNYFKKSDSLSENPAPYIYYSDFSKETVWIYIGRTGFTLFRRFRRLRRAPSSQMNIVCSVLQQNIFWGPSVSEKIISYVVLVSSNPFSLSLS